MIESEENVACGYCRRSDTFSAPVSVILVFAPGLHKPYPLIPGEDYCVCTACDAVYRLVDRAVEAHPATRAAGFWTRAIIVYTDGRGSDIRTRRRTQQLALA